MSRSRTIVVQALAIAGALLLSALDLLVGDSLLYPYGNALGLAILVCAGLAGGLALRTGRRLIAMLFLLPALLALWLIVTPWADRHAVLAGTDGAKAAMGRHFVVGYENLAQAREMVRDAQVGGIFLTQRNVRDRTVEAVAEEVAGLQGLRRNAGLPALIVATDQEGGPVSHLSPPLPLPPALSTLAVLPAQARAEAARQAGAAMGRELRRIGVTMDLAPVVDLRPRDAPGALDLHTRIQMRSISDDPAVVAVIAAGVSSGLIEAGITPTAKHFPGLARVPTDTHVFSAALAAPAAGLAARDWRPFRAVLVVPGTALMLSHVSLAAVDAGVPVSRSRPVVSGLLRGQWGFDGLIITDDLTMGAVEHAGLCRAVEGALNAGVDLLLVSWDTSKAYPALRCALDALSAGRLDAAQLQRSAQRLERRSPGPL